MHGGGGGAMECSVLPLLALVPGRMNFSYMYICAYTWYWVLPLVEVVAARSPLSLNNYLPDLKVANVIVI